jgi:hypothetical protein
MAMTRLVLDDVRTLTFPDGVPAHHVRTWPAARELLRSQAWDEVYLDFDLGEQPGAALDENSAPLVSWIVSNPDQVRVGRFVLHTLNSVGRGFMRALLSGRWPVADVWMTPQTRRPLLVLESEPRGKQLRMADDGSLPDWNVITHEWLMGLDLGLDPVDDATGDWTGDPVEWALLSGGA